MSVQETKGARMGRRRTYKEADVLDKATHVFRRLGYGQTSLRDLERATSLSPGSIYHAYAGKEGLFGAALEHYNATVLQARIDRYAPAETGLAGLQQLFLTLLAEPDGQRWGCLVTNTAIELNGHIDGQGHPGVRFALNLLNQTFADRLRASSPSLSDATLSAHTTRLLALYQGVLVLVRCGHELDSAHHMITTEFEILEAALHVD